jgi:adenosylcobinamide amidohydrolase
MGEPKEREGAPWTASKWIGAPAFTAFRFGRFLVARLEGPHRVLTTSPCVHGLSENVSHIVNHQSCEAVGHTSRYEEISRLGREAYHREVCRSLSLGPEATAVMGTAANMMYAAHEAASFGDLRVDAIVTGGVDGNATSSGDPADWVETPEGWNKLPPVPGTINTIVVVSRPLAPDALVRALMTVTEGKTGALLDLSVSSRQSRNLATGTGTDQVAIAAPVRDGEYQYTSASPHSKLGEMLGLSVRNATKRALQWENGLEPSLTRGLLHSLRRFGVSENSFVEAMDARLDADALKLLKENQNCVLYDPQVAAAVYAFVAVWDRVRAGVLPSSLAGDVFRQQAASIASALAAQTDRWYAFWQRLEVDPARPLDAVFDAIALGWTMKWTSAG